MMGKSPKAVCTLKALLHEGKLLNGKPALIAGRYPSCFYPDDVYNPGAPEVGLLRSFFLLRVTRHIWTSPSSAFDGAEKLKLICNARAHGQFTMTPPMIVYSCCQARTMLSTSEWSRKDGKCNYESLFNAVVKLFENPTSPWTVNTLAWYQKGVFGNCEETGADTSSDEDEDSGVAAIAARSSASSDSA